MFWLWPSSSVESSIYKNISKYKIRLSKIVVGLCKTLKLHICFMHYGIHLMWWLHRNPEGLESDLRKKIGQNGSGVGRQDLMFLLCYLSEGRNLLLNTGNNSGDSPSLGTSSPTVWNVSKRSGNFSRVASSGQARMSVASPSQIGRMSLEDSYVTRHGRKSVTSHS